MTQSLYISPTTRDLVIQGGSPVMVEGSKKVEQGIRSVILERIGNDQHHLGWGSTIVDLIGSIDDPNALRTTIRHRLILALKEYSQELVDELQSTLIRATTDSQKAIMLDAARTEIIQSINNVVLDIEGRTTRVKVEVTVGDGTNLNVLQNFEVGS